jgi:Chromo (CHRromatin Organisation MOdifier) domain
MPEHSQNYPELPLELIDDQPEYEVEQVLGSRRVGRHHKLQYLLRWKGYSAAHDSWEAAAETNCPNLIKEFYTANPTAIRSAQRTYINPSEINYDDIPSSPMNPDDYYTTETQSSPSHQSQDSNKTGLALCQSTLTDQSTELTYYNQQENEENQWINCNDNNEEEFDNEDHQQLVLAQRHAVREKKQRQAVPPYYQQLKQCPEVNYSIGQYDDPTENTPEDFYQRLDGFLHSHENPHYYD